ncbi:hypothetical protein LMG18090_02854 [Ralstonia mannitolilytica]|uniref:T6SS phospholipase effector Tle1-like catalytic domain-containing protein n=1 Tax=Ralstonia mannitolilytica TaxID=105219 RepID=UPI0028F55D6F|nr:DUF2235 domain-containing protein [Ralstonia mannitolilytica]CAJ0792526.1 hypothetical protein LMG18090_02854 [Ralstonia mannitolilytica]
MSNAKMSRVCTPLEQPIENRASGADAATLNSAATIQVVPPATPSTLDAASSLAHRSAEPKLPCQQSITISFFFDGTGNNLDADTPTGEHSNVARLFRAHVMDDEEKQVHRRYIPGLGTYFNAIGDPGGTKTGRGMGALGQKRLDWAFSELGIILGKAESRANNPSNKILKVGISVFGFSRGAASARAFCRDLQARCSSEGKIFKLKPGRLFSSNGVVKGGYQIEVFFLGIFDTVASVGLPMSANNTLTKRRNGVGWRDLIGPAGASYGEAERDLRALAFGDPGADPSPGPADGHGAWADGLQIPKIVSKCAHLVSGHEMRNSFPLDSALDGLSYPQGTIEAVLPGVHSDVGGGYRQGEQGKASVLPIVPLRDMLNRAIAAGVPMYSLSQLPTSSQQEDFALVGPAAKRYEEMLHLWRTYMGTIPSGLPLGKAVLAHMRQYWRYRVSAAVLRTRGKKTTEQNSIQSNEDGMFKKDRARLKSVAEKQERSYRLAAAEVDAAEQAAEAAKQSPAFSNQEPFWRAKAQEASSRRDKAYDSWRRAQARLDTAADDSDLLENMQTYDKWLLEDAELIYKWHKEDPNKRMRPHYAAIVSAYEEVVVNGKVLAETSDLYKFFSTYVHDSLSGFATDNTRTTDPRVLYIGGDQKEKYAAVQTEKQLEVA